MSFRQLAVLSNAILQTSHIKILFHETLNKPLLKILHFALYRKSQIGIMLFGKS